MSRIAYVVSQFPAPSHTFIRREIAALCRRGLDIHPFSVRPGVPATDEIPSVLGQPRLRLIWLAAAASVRHPLRTLTTWLLAQRHRAGGVRPWLWAQFHFVEALVLAEMLRKAGVDRVHSHFANSGATVAMLAANQLQIPWSLTLHGISETDPPAGALLGEKIERADFVACASWFMRAQGMRLVTPEHWSKFHTVRCGLELPPARPRSPGTPKSKFRFVTVGRISAEKGYPGLLQAFAGVVARGVDAELEIVGDGSLRTSFQRQIDRTHLIDRITLHGTLPESETLDAIAIADVFVLPSLMEGLPVVLVEAMALYKPVIAACVAGIPELVEHGRTGLLYKPGDWKDLESCMHRIATEPRLRGDLSSASRKRVEEEFDVEHSIAPLVSLLGHGQR